MRENVERDVAGVFFFVAVGVGLFSDHGIDEMKCSYAENNVLWILFGRRKKIVFE